MSRKTRADRESCAVVLSLLCTLILLCPLALTFVQQGASTVCTQVILREGLALEGGK